ncbi:MAG: AIR synthase-related protein [Bacteroidales bacterium]|jgi:phosphoribosylformylglycinamidine synthase|nr:AIR synthase-related protein [Bacteroidales bacterium]MDD2824054.1 AIR synthase-related protein [Bacteroidales bacterium]MDD3100245.1 AIR synthase-related protein [Bacteroidales bacterium]MDD3639057.1 AIR synthase-related protein [Bacteroidales bacterium]MDD3943616.1 AIR synthase-related protein [Bacteroidales bacterium]
MDTHTTLQRRAVEIAARLRSEGADKPAPEDSFGLFKHKGDMIYLVGDTESKKVDLDKDYRIQKVMLSAMRKNLVSCVQEVSEGGVFEALLRAAMPAELGFDITTDSEIPEEKFLFEDPGTCAVVTVPIDKDEELVQFLFDNQVTVMTLGHVTKGDIRIDDQSYGNIRQI